MHRLGLGLLVSVVAISCAKSDLGAPCHLLTSSNAEVQPVPHQTVVQSGNGECQQFACVSFDGSPPVCSQPCAVEGDSCGNGYTCRSSMLTPALMQALRSRTQGTDENSNGVDDYQELTAGLTDSLFCGPG